MAMDEEPWCGLDLFFFFFNDTATTEIYTLSLHDALPIYLPDQCFERCNRYCAGFFEATAGEQPMTTTLSEIENSADQFCVDTHSERIDRPIFTNRARLTKVNSMLFAGLRDSVAFEIGHSVSEVQAVFTQFRS